MQAIMYTAVIQAILQTLSTSDLDKLSLLSGLPSDAITLVMIETFLPISPTSQNNSRNAVK